MVMDRMRVGSLLFVAVLCFGCQKKQNEIVIGEFGSLTGGTATFGVSSHEEIGRAHV